ncbi:MAG: hypothetical protein U1D30_06515 [Planctomycetota bacterium]
MKRTVALGLLGICAASAEAQVFYFTPTVVTPTVVAPAVRYYVPSSTATAYYVPSTSYYVPATSTVVPATSFYVPATAPAAVSYYVPAAAPTAVPATPATASVPAVQFYVPAGSAAPQQIERYYFYGSEAAPKNLPGSPTAAGANGGTILREYYYLPPESRGSAPSPTTKTDPTLKMPDPNRALSEEALKGGLPAEENKPQPKQDPPAGSTDATKST